MATVSACTAQATTVWGWGSGLQGQSYQPPSYLEVQGFLESIIFKVQGIQFLLVLRFDRDVFRLYVA